MKTSLRTRLLCWLFISAILTANAQQRVDSLTYPALDKIDQLRSAQGDQNLNPKTERVNSTEQPAIPLGEGDSKRTASDGRKYNTLLSDAALDRFFANQTVRYLTGKTDLSYYNTYFTASSGDGSFNLGRTMTHKDQKLEQVLAVTNIGFKTNLLSGLGSLFSERVWNREVGAFLNHTWLQRGSIWFDKNRDKVLEMDLQRAYLRQTIQAEINQELSAFDAIQQAALDKLPAGSDVADFKARQKIDRDKFYNALNEKEVKQFLEREEAAGKKHINYARKSWITTRGSLSGTSYRVLTDVGDAAKTQNFVPFRAGVDYSFYAEDFRASTAHRLLFTASATLFNTNKPRILERYGTKAAEALGGEQAKDEGGAYWQGDASTIMQGSLQARAYLTLPRLAPKWSNNVSLDLFADVGVGRYSAHDAGAGVLFTLPSQDDTKPVNVELLFKFTDISRKLLPGKDALDRLLIGLSLALPIDGTLNKL